MLLVFSFLVFSYISKSLNNKLKFYFLVYLNLFLFFIFHFGSFNGKIVDFFLLILFCSFPIYKKNKSLIIVINFIFIFVSPKFMQSKVLQAKCVYCKVSKYLFCFLNGEKIVNFRNKIKLNFLFSSVNFNLI